MLPFAVTLWFPFCLFCLPCLSVWDYPRLERFRWLWWEITTFSPYESESSFATHNMDRDGEGREQGITYVLKSLTPNHRQILVLLAEEQRSNPQAGGRL